MAAVARGALGATKQYNTTSGYSRQVPLRSTPVSHPVATVPPASNPVATPPAGSGGGMYIPPPAGTTLPVATVPPPIQPLPPISAPPASGGSSSGSGGSAGPAGPSGSSGSTSTGVVLTNPGIDPLPTLAPLPDDGRDLSATSPDHTLRNVALIGGAAVAAYFLFFRKKKGTSP